MVTSQVTWRLGRKTINSTTAITQAANQIIKKFWLMKFHISEKVVKASLLAGWVRHLSGIRRRTDDKIGQITDQYQR
jgi:hypothetical protein